MYKARNVTERLFLGQNSLTENNRNKTEASSWAKENVCLPTLEVEEGLIDFRSIDIQGLSKQVPPLFGSLGFCFISFQVGFWKLPAIVLEI